jgi:hypothetical protein
MANRFTVSRDSKGNDLLLSTLWVDIPMGDRVEKRPTRRGCPGIRDEGESCGDHVRELKALLTWPLRGREKEINALYVVKTRFHIPVAEPAAKRPHPTAPASHHRDPKSSADSGTTNAVAVDACQRRLRALI